MRPTIICMAPVNIDRGDIVDGTAVPSHSLGGPAIRLGRFA